jgi:hypothetical protein
MTGLDLLIWIIAIILVIIIVWYLVWYFAIRDPGRPVGAPCSTEGDCQRGLRCARNATCQAYC